MFKAGVVASSILSTLLRAAETVASFAMEASAATGRRQSWHGPAPGTKIRSLHRFVTLQGKFGKFDWGWYSSQLTQTLVPPNQNYDEKSENFEVFV